MDAHTQPQIRFQELLDLSAGMVARHLSSHEITHIWPEQHRILFRTAGGETGEVEVCVHWDIEGGDAQNIKTAETLNE